MKVQNMNELTVTTEIFKDIPVRIVRMGKDRVIPVNDIADGIGYDRDNLRRMLVKNKEQFQPYMVNVIIPSSDGNEHSSNGLLRDGVFGVFMKLQSGRIKDPARRQRILDFQHWVMEAIGKIMDGLPVESTSLAIPTDARVFFEQQMGLAKVMHDTMGVNLGIAGARTISYVEEKTGCKFELQRELLPAFKQSEIGYMNATKVGERIGLLAPKTNTLLSDMGLHYRHGKDWILTPLGEEYAEKKPFDVILPNGSKHSDFQNLWKESVIDKIEEYQRSMGCDPKSTHDKCRELI